MRGQRVGGLPNRPRRVLVGIAMAGVLLVVHVTVWRAARDAFVRHAAYPLIAAIDTERSAGFMLDADSFDRTITAMRGGTMEVYRAPANMDYLLAALVLIAVFPRRPYWFWLWLAHLALGMAALAAFAVGVGWWDVGFDLGLFIRVYAARAVSLLALVAALAPAWADRLNPRAGPRGSED